MKRLKIKGARQHNLKNLYLEIGLNSITCVSGPSGAGKSSLVFDTIYAEAQRRYIETFSPYTRQFLERIPRPDVDQLENLQAAVAIGQANPVRNSRSTVATLTELTFTTRMLFYKQATPYCPRCNQPFHQASWRDVLELLHRSRSRGAKRAWLTIEIDKERLGPLVAQGFHRVLHGTNQLDLSDPDLDSIKGLGKDLLLIIERFSLKSLEQSRIQEAVELGFSLGGGSIVVVTDDGEDAHLSSNLACPSCGKTLEKASPLLFSFNSPEGACPNCNGFGRIIDIDWDLVIPNKELSLLQGAIKPLKNWQEEQEELFHFCKQMDIPLDVPWKELPRETQDWILYGKGEWYGIKAIFDWLESKRYKAHIRILLSRYRAYIRCPVCKGSRFSERALAYRLGNLNIGQFYQQDVEKALQWCKRVARDTPLDKASSTLLQDLIRRLEIIKAAGLSYLTLDRQSRSLSGGELSRLCLSKGVSTRLSDTLYCLDEPSSGLHPADIKGVCGVINRLRQAGNTIIMVENDPIMSKVADQILELGPGSGHLGGQLLKAYAPGDPNHKMDLGPLLEENKKTPGTKGWFTIRGARAHNLRDVTCAIPLEALTCVCGVSGSGKSSLVETCIYRGLLRMRGEPCNTPGPFASMENHQHFDSVILVDQEPIARTPRACPGTYLKLLDPIRRLFANTKSAKIQGLKPGFFSLNVEGGRCPQCKGQGYELVEMQFLPDLMVPCPECKGKRFTEGALEIEYQGKNIAQCLEMTLEEAGLFFKDLTPIRKPLQVALALGLGHLRIGQPLNTLSAGEAQRLKIARSLSGLGRNALFILDEPTRGLHPKEVKGLLEQLKILRDLGHTLILVEHDLQALCHADWIIELGPGGGEDGGQVIYEGPPLGLKRAPTPTGLAIRHMDSEASYTDEITGQGDNIGPQAEGIDLQETASPDLDYIEIKGTRHHNLKDLDIRIPKEKLVVITGVSGSGKSSLAFDIVHREAQRRYLESLPSYMKQFVRLHEPANLDSISGLSPSVAIEQRTSRGGSMSTVATLSETAHYLRLLYAHFSMPVCPECGAEMQKTTTGAILEAVRRHLATYPEMFILAPRIRMRKGWHQDEIERGFKHGADLVRVDGRLIGPGEQVALSRYKEHNIEWLWGPFDSLDNQTDIDQVVQQALTLGGGTIGCVSQDGEEIYLSKKYLCSNCQISVPDPDPLLFSFHTTTGKCTSCGGRGQLSTGETCPECRGSRLSHRARLWHIDHLNIAGLFSLEIHEAERRLRDWLKHPLPYRQTKGQLWRLLLEQALIRLEIMEGLGLGYLSLDRSGDTLSGGEAQRIRLAVQTASSLTGLTIVLDEPTIGLHPIDNQRLINTLKKLRDKGNSVLVVEHDRDTILAADHVIDLGPGGGTRGGQVVFSGDVPSLLKSSVSRTAKALRSAPTLRNESCRINNQTSWLTFKKAKVFNLKSIGVRIPTGALTVITGVSGSGKSTLLHQIIYQALKGEPPEGLEFNGQAGINGVYKIDHSPIGKTPRSCPATFMGFFSHIRELFSRTPAARIKGYSPGHFSFNTQEGACPSCKGQGVIRQRLGILPDVLITCQTCQGRRFIPPILDIRWKGLDINQVLEMTVAEARDLFKTIPKLRRPLDLLVDLGLEYLTLGQTSPSLSGGEAQRLKIAKELSRPGRSGMVYLLDEPSLGLHMDDVRRLCNCLNRLVDAGNTVVVVEHDMSIISQADWIIDLGPGGGKYGGQVLFQGPLDEFVSPDTSTDTANALRSFLSP